METKIWTSNWVPSISSPPISINANFENYNYVSDLIDVNDNSWNLDLLSSLFSPMDVIRIRTIKITAGKKDEIMWAHTTNGKYTVKSAYKIFMNESFSAEEVSFWKKVWSLDCLPKINFFMWKIFARMLPVNSILKFYNADKDDCCPLCCNEVETVTHLFFLCPIASHIWFALSLQHLGPTDAECVEDIFLSWFDKKLGLSPYPVNWPSVGAIVLWSIWKLRCDVVFKNVQVNLDKVVLDVKRSLNTYIVPHKTCLSARLEVKVPKKDFDHIMFMDGSYKNFNMGVGIILCDLAGSIRKFRVDFGQISSAVGAETTALILALSWARDLNLSKILFVSDCLQMVHYVNEGKGDLDWRCLDLLEECRISLSSSLSYKVVYIKRAKNNIVDRLASRARKFSLKNIWDSSPPFLDSIMREVSLKEVCNGLFS